MNDEVKPWPFKNPPEYVCRVPDELGRVVGLEVRNEKVIAITESGIEMIVPVRTR